jgi:hypothetical protein
LEVHVHKINTGRLILAGVVTAVVLDVLEFLDNGVLLANDWANALKAIGVGPLTVRGIIAFNIWSVVVGFLALCLYVAVRPRFGPGPRTALMTAAVVWAFGWPLSMVAPLASHMIPKSLAINAVLLGIPEIAISLLVGAAVYKEGSAGTDRVVAAAA